MEMTNNLCIFLQVSMRTFYICLGCIKNFFRGSTIIKLIALLALSD